MKTRRELAQEQLDLMNEIRSIANINIVTCGNCGTTLLQDMSKQDSIECFGCKSEMDISDCPDLWYDGCTDNPEFDN